MVDFIRRPSISGVTSVKIFLHYYKGNGPVGSWVDESETHGVSLHQGGRCQPAHMEAAATCVDGMVRRGCRAIIKE